MVGERYGRLTVIREVSPAFTCGGRKMRQVLCLCDCGAEKVVRVNNLRRGATTSCGCLAKEVRMETVKKASIASSNAKGQLANNLIGQTFGDVTVVGVFMRRSKRYATVKCSCGKTFDVTANNLIRGKTLRCRECHDKVVTAKFKKNECVEGTALCKLTQKVRSDSTTGVKGVWFDKRSGKYCAEIRLSGKKHWLGSFYELSEAEKARKRAEEELYNPVLEKYGREMTNNKEDF